ncbi:MAG: tetratricopeptide repeat protein [Bacteroidetes bacterium]|nr:tetratricopeptide repeat protein [Bacteroidota bacterium]
MAQKLSEETSGTPPVLSLDFFYWQYNRAGKRLFILAYAVLALMAVLLLVADSLPGRWALDVLPDSLHQTEALSAHNYTHNYREVPVMAQGSWNYTIYGAGMIQPTLSMLLILLVAISVGWSVLLAASARFADIWGYLIYLGHALFIYLAGSSELIFRHPSPYLALIPIFGFILPAYLFKEQMLKASLWVQFWLFLGLHLLLFGLVLGFSGYAGLFQLAVTGYPVHVAITLLFILACAKELLQLLVFMGNSRAPHTRLSVGRLSWLLLPLVLLMLMQALSYTGLLPAGFRLFSPMWLLVPAVLLIVFTAQNSYFQLRDIIPANLAFSLLILGAGILSLGNLAYWFMAGEYTLRFVLHKHTALIFGLVGVFQLIYLYANFGPLLAQRVNVYYMLFKAPRFRFAAVWFAALLGVVLVEGMARWSGVRAVQASYYQQKGDAQLIAGIYETEIPPVEQMVAEGDAQIAYGAQYWYELAVEKLPVTVKASYNLAALRIAKLPAFGADDVEEISTLYKFTGSPGEFPYAYVNWGRFLAQAGRIPQAKQVLHSYVRSYPHPHVYLALSGIYFHTQDPDSAILMLKEALRLDPNDGIAYANMAAVYHKWKRPQQALAFAKAAFKTQPQAPAVQENYWFLMMQAGEVPEEVTIDPEQDLTPVTDSLRYPYYALMNKALAACRAGNWNGADQLAARLLEYRETPDALLLRLITQTGRDSLEHAASRYLYLSEFYPPFKARAAEAMGTYCYRKSAYHQARVYYRTAAEAGSAPAALWAAWSLLDLGAHEKAYEELQKVAVDHPMLADLCTQEMALLDSAYGLPSCFIGWNFAGITPLQAMRLGVYAAGRQKLHICTRAFAFVLQQDSTTVRPFIEMARAYAQEPDFALARTQLDAGLKRHPHHPELLCEKAMIYLREGNTPQGLATLAPLEENNMPLVLATRGRLVLAKGDTARAISLYRQALEQDPWNLEWLEQLATIYTLRKEPLEAYLLMTRAIRLNDADPWLMTRYAWSAFDLGKYKDAQEAMRAALKNAEPFPELRPTLQAQQQALEQAITRVEESTYVEDL